MITKAEIDRVRSLSDKQGRTENGLFVVEGDKMTGEVVGSSFRLDRLYTTSLSQLANHPRATMVSEKEMSRLSRLKTPSASLATVHIPSRSFDSRLFGSQMVVALDEVQDPGNMGTIIRLCDWFGVRHIICSSSSADCFNPKVVQATMGALLRVEVHYGNLTEWLGEAARMGTEVCGTLLEGGTDLYSTAVENNCVLVMGSEGHGMAKENIAMLTKRLFIPPYPADRQGSESLNVAMATAVTLGEIRRKNR